MLWIGFLSPNNEAMVAITINGKDCGDEDAQCYSWRRSYNLNGL
jgi:hypothetical protein